MSSVDYAFNTKETRRVSIICVTYQHEKFALDAVGGLLQQTYLPFEIIILDDASADATADIIAGELAKHPHRTDIRLVRNERNLGYPGNVLKGVEMAGRIDPPGPW